MATKLVTVFPARYVKMEAAVATLLVIMQLFQMW
jgi:hypothetical protein